jgi:uncharacterized protein YrrD
MHIKLGAKVYNSDDQQVGTVSHIILYPGTKEITHLVAQKGQDMTHQTLVPVDSIYSADEKRVVLQQHAEDLMSGRQFQHGGEVALTESEMAADQPASASALHNLPDGTVALKEGAKVVTSDGQNVGDVDHFNATENRITDLFITKGKLLKTRRLIQSELISSILENEIRLNVDADFINSLPEPRPDTAGMTQ